MTRLPGPLRVALVAVGAVALACAPLPSSTTVGVVLAVEGALLVLVGVWGRVRPISPGDLLAPGHPEPRGAGPDVTRRAALCSLGLITLLALVLRIVQLDSDLWLDEIVTVQDYADRSVGAIFTTYEGANNHLLNSLVVHLSLAVFGHEEWAIRLPAAVTGVLTVPAFYWVSRIVFPRAASLLAALALAVSYHHVFFSQNARGYAPLLLFGLLATGLLMRALRTDAWWAWPAYAATATLSAVSVPTGGFVLLGHGAVVVAALVVVRRAGGAVRPLLGRALAVYVAIGLVLAQAYASVVSQAASVAQDAWSTAGAGFDPLSLGFAHQLADDVSARGPLAAVVALAAVLVGLVGLVSLARRDWALLLGLSLGPLLHAAFVVARGLAFSPRFLVALLFPALLVAVETVRVLARRAGGRRGERTGGAVQIAGGVLLCAALALPLLPYYQVPKQPFRAAVEYAAVVRDGGVVVPVYTAQLGVRYYGVQHPVAAGLVEGETVRNARTAQALERIVADADGRRLVLVTTFSRALRLDRPRLDAMVHAGWRPAKTFAAGVGDGDVTVWLPVR